MVLSKRYQRLCLESFLAAMPHRDCAMLASDAIAACRAVVDNWEHGDLAAAARQCAEALMKAGVNDE